MRKDGVASRCLKGFGAPLVRDRLRLQQRRQLGLKLVAVGLLIEEDPIAEKLVVSLNLPVDVFVTPEIALGREDDGDQGKLGLVDRETIAAESVDQTLVQVVEQAAAVLGEGVG